MKSRITRTQAEWVAATLEGYAVMVSHYPGDRVPWAAYLRAVPGCIAQGHTRNAALADLVRIWPHYRDRLVEIGVTIPEPDGDGVVIDHVEWLLSGVPDPEDAE